MGPRFFGECPGGKRESDDLFDSCVFLMRGVYKRLGTIHVVLASLVERVTECMVVAQYRLTWFGKSLSRPALIPTFCGVATNSRGLVFSGCGAERLAARSGEDAVHPAVVFLVAAQRRAQSSGPSPTPRPQMRSLKARRLLNQVTKRRHMATTRWSVLLSHRLSHVLRSRMRLWKVTIQSF